MTLIYVLGFATMLIMVNRAQDSLHRDAPLHTELFVAFLMALLWPVTLVALVVAVILETRRRRRR